ncbi:hypothetical protein [Collimonas sp. PA-H2]|uniref:hypothetical protein n=1 Tax=Collimonas sp. PA-H2 TaxID=1881062 RepID=UPI000BF9B57F|nr:hypothetical protein [Collimonas sp. PA-H2]
MQYASIPMAGTLTAKHYPKATQCTFACRHMSTYSIKKINSLSPHHEIAAALRCLSGFRMDQKKSTVNPAVCEARLTVDFSTDCNGPMEPPGHRLALVDRAFAGAANNSSSQKQLQNHKTEHIFA